MNYLNLKTDLLILCFFSLTIIVFGQQKKEPSKIVAGIPVNYNEDSVGTYTLPDLMILNNGKKVNNSEVWIKKRRPEILEMCEDYMFGHSPEKPEDMSFKIFDKGTPTYEGQAIRRQVTVYFSKDTTGPKMDLLVFLPNNTTKPSPLFLNISFSPNYTGFKDPGVKQGFAWSRNGERKPATKESFMPRFDIIPFIKEGIGVAFVYYGDIEPDFDGGRCFGVRSLYPMDEYDWGGIDAWSWGLSRAMDYFETDNSIDHKKVAISGISRLGKTVLWAGAHDERFAVVIASVSGEGGAALSKRNYGENIAHITAPSRYWYWFNDTYRTYADRVDELPIDGHMLVALMAPRPLLLQTGTEDYWSDPKGEFLSAIEATPVYELFGEKGMESKEMPKAGEEILNTLGYYMHEGPHGAFPSDYEVFLKYLVKYLKD